MAERRQWTEEDLAALRQAAATLERLGVWTVYVGGLDRQRTEMHVSARDLVAISRLPGVTVAQPRYRHPRWEVRADVGDTVVFALMETDELPTVGWRYVDRQPAIEILEEVTPVDSAHAS